MTDELKDQEIEMLQDEELEAVSGGRVEITCLECGYTARYPYMNKMALKKWTCRKCGHTYGQDPSDENVDPRCPRWRYY
ncbi:MAG: hypothetical protein PUC32_01300 [Oscillospiraceae bacterium]|nr:hypothetical protein [Oscillospiraceae bacterium]